MEILEASLFLQKIRMPTFHFGDGVFSMIIRFVLLYLSQNV